jgi:hypothetical protein
MVKESGEQWLRTAVLKFICLWAVQTAGIAELNQATPARRGVSAGIAAVIDSLDSASPAGGQDG